MIIIIVKTNFFYRTVIDCAIMDHGYRSLHLRAKPTRFKMYHFQEVKRAKIFIFLSTF